MFSDFVNIYLFWMVILAIGLINLPLTFVIFAKFADRGYVFSKILGIALLSYITFILSAFQLLPFTQITVLLVFSLLTGVNLLILRQLKKKGLLKHHLNRNTIWLFIIEEALFLTGLIFWSVIRGYAPDIHGLEKFMDFGFINSILRTKYLPPMDIWLTRTTDTGSYTGGFFINYYYFGHFITALLVKFTAISAEITYNIMLGFLFAITFTGAFSISFNLIYQISRNIKKCLLGALLAGFLVALGGNLHTIYVFTKGYGLDNPVPFWRLLGGVNVNSYWYPNATRFIPNTIHEFPIYSFVVSDLHGHVLDIPFVLLTIALLFSIFISAQKSKLLILLGFLLAVMYMTNAWDAIIYFGLSGLVLLYLNTRFHGVRTLSGIMNYEFEIMNFRFRLLPLILKIIFLFITFYLLSYPFNRHFVPFAKGIGINCITPNASNQVLCDHSPFYMLAILWGYFYYFAASFILFIIIPAIKKWLNVHQKFQLSTSDIFVVFLIIISTLLLIAPEFIFARDIYPAHYRANTMFKFGYEAFMMLGISVSYIVVRFLLHSPFKRFYTKIAWWFLAVILLFLAGIYPLFAINSYYGGLTTYQGLDGVTWLKKDHPGDAAAIDYFRGTLLEFDQPAVLEAVGESYTDYARISAHTGLPTIVGWPVHEWLWRGSYDEAGKRQEEVRKIYESESIDEAKILLEKYRIEYVIVGKLEEDKYPQLNQQTFFDLGSLVFEKEGTRIFKINSL